MQAAKHKTVHTPTDFAHVFPQAEKFHSAIILDDADPALVIHIRNKIRAYKQNGEITGRMWSEVLELFKQFETAVSIRDALKPFADGRREELTLDIVAGLLVAAGAQVQFDRIQAKYKSEFDAAGSELKRAVDEESEVAILLSGKYKHTFEVTPYTP